MIENPDPGEAVDSVEPAGHGVQPGVESDDGQHRPGSDAVEERRYGRASSQAAACVSVRAHVASAKPRRPRRSPPRPLLGETSPLRRVPLCPSHRGPPPPPMTTQCSGSAFRARPGSPPSPWSGRPGGPVAPGSWRRRPGPGTERFARKQGIPRVTGLLPALVDDPEIDAVYNPLPNGLHGRWTIAALRAGKQCSARSPLPPTPRRPGQYSRWWIAPRPGRRGGLPLPVPPLRQAAGGDRALGQDGQHLEHRRGLFGTPVEEG